jgi:hypothetical protein
LRYLDQLVGVKQKVVYVVPANNIGEKEEAKALIAGSYPREMGFDVLVIPLWDSSDGFLAESHELKSLLAGDIE